MTSKDKDKAPDMMKDFRAFNLRKQDVANASEIEYYGGISERYTLIDFNSSETEPLSNILDDIYHEQYKYMNWLNYRVRGPDYSQRDSESINLDLSAEQKNSRITNITSRLKKSIEVKEEALEYLTQKYNNIISEHKKITLFPFAFYLSDEWIERHEEKNYTFSFESLNISLEELKRRFDAMTKIMKTNSEYKSACAYIRAVVLDECYRPFYFVIFFFKGNDLGNVMPKKIWYQWLDSGARGERDCDQRGVFYPFDIKHSPKTEDLYGLIIHKPENGIKSEYKPEDLYRNIVDEIMGSRYAEKLISLKNNRSGHFAFFRFLARRINRIPPNKALVFSNDFTYLTNKEKKELSNKRKAEKEAEANKLKIKKSK